MASSENISDAQDYRVAQTPQSGLSFGGNNGRGNMVQVDGAETLSASGGVQATLSQEAVQDFQVVRLIMTDKSRWAIVTNRYTGLRESRFMLADVYVKSKVSGKCYLQQEVYFSQGADPFDGFIYSTFVSVPQTLQPYPCDLK